jgi:hypothetical protein
VAAAPTQNAAGGTAFGGGGWVRGAGFAALLSAAFGGEGGQALLPLSRGVWVCEEVHPRRALGHTPGHLRIALAQNRQCLSTWWEGK